MTLFGHFQGQWVRPLVEVVAPGQGKVNLSYDQRTLVYGNADVSRFLGIPVSVTLSLNMEQRFYTGTVRVEQASGEGVNVTTYAYEVSNSLLHQPYIVKTTVTDEKRQTVYSYTPTIRQRQKWVDKYKIPTEGGGEQSILGSFSLQLWPDLVSNEKAVR